MGVRGLTTFISNRSRQYLESYELHDCYLVVDGNCVACQLYRWHTKCNDCFGGDYDKFAQVVISFFQLLQDCGVTPLVVFDGAYEDRKMKTVYSRIKNRVQEARVLNTVTEGTTSVFPLFLRELFADLLVKLNIKCVRCDFECDSDAAFLARSLDCPVLSYDSDFYITDALYIPFDTMRDLRLRRRKNVSYISCEVYRVERFLTSFGGMSKENLPLLGVLLGNDYIKRNAFSRFYRQLKMPRTQENSQQKMIKGLIMWLKNETPESALRKILGRYKMRSRRNLAHRIQMAIQGYQGADSQICSFFDLGPVEKPYNAIQVPQPEDIEEASDDDVGEEEISSEEEVRPKASPKAKATPFFQKNFRKCLYPACFMEIIVTDTYYCIPQIEDCSMEHSHTISLDIIRALHKIISVSEAPNVTVVARNEHLHIKKFSVPTSDKSLPKLAEIETMNQSQTNNLLLKVLAIPNGISEAFPASWHVFLLSIKYWVANSRSRVNLPHIYSLVLGALVMNCVDPIVGYYRSTRSFVTKFGASNPHETASPSTATTIPDALKEIDATNGIACLRKLIYYFQMDVKMRGNYRLFDRRIIHDFAELQSCLLHIKYLNALLKFPLPELIVSDFYDGTFLYNMTANLLKRTDLKAYVKILLGGCPQILRALELMVEEIKGDVSFDVAKRQPAKRRKKRKKANNVAEAPVAEIQSEEECFMDENNLYSLLNFINK